MLDRRRFIVSSGFAGGMLLQACKTTSSLTESLDGPAPLVRRRWTATGDDAIKKKYIQAVTWLKANDDQTFPAEDPRSFLSWKKILQIHQSSCQHGNDLIFPWHRLYLQYFEQACRYALQDPTFALPYWDWTLDRKIPGEFFSETILLADRKMKDVDQIPEEFVGEKVIDGILSTDNFFTVHSRAGNPMIRGRGINVGGFERAPHNGVHNSVGGIMANPFDSPMDPLFWLHHCNIDRVWATWQSRHPTLVIPSHDGGLLVQPPTAAPGTDKPDAPQPMALAGGRTGGILRGLDLTPWEDKTLRLSLMQGSEDKKDFIPPMPETSWTRAITNHTVVRGIVDIRQLGYSYDTIPEPLPIRIVSKLVLQKKKRATDLFPITGAARGDTLVASLNLNAGDYPARVERLKKERDFFATVAVNDVAPPADDELKSQMIVRVFAVAGSYPKARPEFAASSVLSLPEYIGVFSFFAHDHGAEGQGQSFSFDITAWLKDYLAKNPAGELSFVAVAVNPAKGFQSVPLFPAGGKATFSLEFDGTVK